MKFTGLFLLVAALWMTQTIDAQAQADSVRPAPHNGCWSIDFGIGPNLTPTSFLKGMLSVSRHLPSGDRIRLGISSYGSQRNQDYAAKGFAADTLSYSWDNNGKDGYRSVSAIAQYVFVSDDTEPVVAYFALGPEITCSWAHAFREGEQIYPPARNEQSSSNDLVAIYGLGLLVNLGAEWRISDRLSLHAEYGLRAKYEWGSDSGTQERHLSSGETSKQVFEQSQTTWSQASAGVLVGVSVLL